MFNSQDNQDRFLETYIFKGYKNGIYVDVGAHDGISITPTEKKNGTNFLQKNKKITHFTIQ